MPDYSILEDFFANGASLPLLKRIAVILGSNPRGRSWPATRLRVLIRDQCICTYCLDAADQADHVIPRVRGGSDHISNLVAACSACNQSKGALTAWEWFKRERMPAPPWFLERMGLKRPILGSVH